MINSYIAFQLYNAYRNHFTIPSYDIVKYNGKIRTSLEKFNNRNDKLYFEKLSKIPDLKHYIISNLIIDNKLYIKDLLLSENSMKNYYRWKKINSSLEYHFLNDCKKLKSNLIDNIEIDNKMKLPYMLELLQRKEISIETICIFYRIMKNLEDKWNMKLENIEWKSGLQHKLYKYNRIFSLSSIDKEKIKQKTIDLFAKM